MESGGYLRELTCKICNKYFENAGEFSEHRCSNIVHSHSCPVCLKQFHSETEYAAHVCIENLICNICYEKFSQESDLISHQKQHNNVSVFFCAKCQEIFNDEYSYSKHSENCYNYYGRNPILHNRYLATESNSQLITNTAQELNAKDVKFNILGKNLDGHVSKGLTTDAHVNVNTTTAKVTTNVVSNTTKSTKAKPITHSSQGLNNHDKKLTTNKSVVPNYVNKSPTKMQPKSVVNTKLAKRPISQNVTSNNQKRTPNNLQNKSAKSVVRYNTTNCLIGTKVLSINSSEPRKNVNKHIANRTPPPLVPLASKTVSKKTVLPVVANNLNNVTKDQHLTNMDNNNKEILHKNMTNNTKIIKKVVVHIPNQQNLENSTITSQISESTLMNINTDVKSIQDVVKDKLKPSPPVTSSYVDSIIANSSDFPSLEDVAVKNFHDTDQIPIHKSIELEDANSNMSFEDIADHTYFSQNSIRTEEVTKSSVVTKYLNGNFENAEQVLKSLFVPEISNITNIEQKTTPTVSNSSEFTKVPNCTTYVTNYGGSDFTNMEQISPHSPIVRNPDLIAQTSAILSDMNFPNSVEPNHVDTFSNTPQDDSSVVSNYVDNNFTEQITRTSVAYESSNIPNNMINNEQTLTDYVTNSTMKEMPNDISSETDSLNSNFQNNVVTNYENDFTSTEQNTVSSNANNFKNTDVQNYVHSNFPNLSLVPNNVNNKDGNSAVVPNYANNNILTPTVVPNNVNNKVGNPVVVPNYVNNSVGNPAVVPNYDNNNVGISTVVPNYMNKTANSNILLNVNNAANPNVVPNYESHSARNSTVVPNYVSNNVENRTPAVVPNYANNNVATPSIIPNYVSNNAGNITVVPNFVNNVSNPNDAPHYVNNNAGNSSVVPNYVNNSVSNHTVVPNNVNNISNPNDVPHYMNNNTGNSSVAPNYVNNSVSNHTVVPNYVNNSVESSNIVPNSMYNTGAAENTFVDNNVTIKQEIKEEIKEEIIEPSFMVTDQMSHWSEEMYKDHSVNENSYFTGQSNSYIDPRTSYETNNSQNQSHIAMNTIHMPGYITINHDIQNGHNNQSSMQYQDNRLFNDQRKDGAVISVNGRDCYITVENGYATNKAQSKHSNIAKNNSAVANAIKIQNSDTSINTLCYRPANIIRKPASNVKNSLLKQNHYIMNNKNQNTSNHTQGTDVTMRRQGNATNNYDIQYQHHSVVNNIQNQHHVAFNNIQKQNHGSMSVIRRQANTIQEQGHKRVKNIQNQHLVVNNNIQNQHLVANNNVQNLGSMSVIRRQINAAKEQYHKDNNNIQNQHNTVVNNIQNLGSVSVIRRQANTIQEHCFNNIQNQHNIVNRIQNQNHGSMSIIRKQTNANQSQGFQGINNIQNQHAVVNNIQNQGHITINTIPNQGFNSQIRKQDQMAGSITIKKRGDINYIPKTINIHNQNYNIPKQEYSDFKSEGKVLTSIVSKDIISPQINNGIETKPELDYEEMYDQKEEWKRFEVKEEKCIKIEPGLDEMQSENYTDSGKVAELYCEICDQYFCTQAILGQHSVYHRRIQLCSCDICNKTSSTTEVPKTLVRKESTKQFTNTLRNLKTEKSQSNDEMTLDDYVEPNDSDMEVDPYEEEMKEMAEVFDETPTDNGKPIFNKIRAETKQVVCNICNQEFQNITLLRKHFKVHGEKIGCDNCSKPFSSMQSLYYHKQFNCVSKTSKGFPCKHCQRSFATRLTLKNHGLLCFDKNAELPFTCDLCDKRFPDNQVLAIHRKTHVKCDICNKIVRCNNICRHRRGHTAREFSCKYCKRKFVRKEKWLLHENYFHANLRERPFVCDLCNLGFYRKDHLQKHKLTICSEAAILKNPFLCDICLKRYPDKPAIRSHITKTHFKFFKCGICELMLTSSIKLKKHLSCHVIDLKNQCNFCENKYPHILGLVRHEKCHYSELKTKYTCGNCQEFFLHQSTYLYHMRRRDECMSAKYPCGGCGRKLYLYRFNININDNETAVTDRLCKTCIKVALKKRKIKAHICNICKEKFPKLVDLFNHELKHSDADKDYTCDCDNKYIHKSCLEYHRRHECEKKRPSFGGYPCDSCNRKFTKESALSYHKRHRCGKTRR